MSEQQRIADKAADNIRILSVAMVEKAKSGHPGGAMGGADFIQVLFSEFLNFDPSDEYWIARDRFFLDPGHMSPMLYAILTFIGKFSMEDLKQFRQWKSVTPGHPELNPKRGIENTSGPLGQGHTMAVGAAIVERFLCARFGESIAHKTYTFVSDGSIQEEIAQGAGRIAGTLGLHNLIMFYDANNTQLSTTVDVVSTENTAMKYEAWGWQVYTINGNNYPEIHRALTKAVQEKEKPTLIIGKTEMAKGAITINNTFLSNKIATHGQPISKAGADIRKTITSLGGNPDNPFHVFEEVKQYYKECLIKKHAFADKKKKEYGKWEKTHPELAQKLQQFFTKNYIPNINYGDIKFEKNLATRSASSAVLAHFGKNAENMIIGSADLSNSDKTDGFLNQTKAFTKGDFNGAFLHAGVSELTLAALCNGMALHGGVIPACATFFVFSDYMKPAIRLSALMELPVKYIFSHDAFRVGEDGPTHQPVEHEAQLRLLEQLKNHSQRTSLRVLRPADSAETIVAWKIAMENTYSPTALIFSRQKIKDLPAKESRIREAQKAEKGAYVVIRTSDNPNVILLGNGSEVATLVDSAILLKEKMDISSSVISVISEGLFKQQSTSYQEKIIPKNKPLFGLTAGLPSTLSGILGANGRCYGLIHFGYSAPANVLDKKFGFTAENIAKEVNQYLQERR